MPLPLLLPLLLLPAADRSIERGSYLFDSCQGAIRAHEASDGGKPIDVALANYCMAYITGFLDGLDLANNHLICPHGATYGTMARVYVLYMQKNPKELDADLSLGMANALLEAYPCPSPKK